MSDDPTRAGADDGDTTETHDQVEVFKATRAKEAAAGIPSMSGFALVVTEGPQRGAYWVLDEGVVEAGRTLESFLLLDDISVSRHHAEFAVTGDTLTMRDLGSTNGTYVNGVRADEATLEAGDELIIGRYHLVVART